MQGASSLYRQVLYLFLRGKQCQLKGFQVVLKEKSLRYYCSVLFIELLEKCALSVFLKNVHGCFERS